MSKFIEIKEFTDNVQSALNSVQKGFDHYQENYFPKRSPEFFCLELNGEAGELANLEKKRWKGKSVPDDAFADEAADVLIALMNYVNERGIDLGEAVCMKLLWIEEKRVSLEENGEEY
jgi:NTP pyrophosphatase (non-canonical NTP hydrolase)